MKQPMTPAGRCPNTPAQVKEAHRLIEDYERINRSLAEMRRYGRGSRHDLLKLTVCNGSNESSLFFPGELYSTFYKAAESAADEIKNRLFLEFGVTISEEK